MITVAGERITRVSPQLLIDRIWSGAEWHPVRAGIKGLAIEYDDGRHQSVQLCVDWRPRNLAVSIMRFRESASRISFFYSRPPEGVIKQIGVWEALAVEDGCCLRLVRSLQLQQGKAESAESFHAREDTRRMLLKEHLGLILDVVVQPVIPCGIAGWREGDLR